MTKITSDKQFDVTETDGLTKVNAEGRLKVHFDDIQTVSIYNIIRLEKYDLSETADFIVHEISFIHGGMAKLAYSKTGKIMEFRSRGIAIRADGDHITLDVPE